MPAPVPVPVDPDLRALAALLRAAGLDPSAEELADALWLAGRTAGAVRGLEGGDPVPAEARVGRPEEEEGKERTEEAPGESPAEPPPVREEPEAEDPVSLYPAGAVRAADGEWEAEIPVGAGVPVRVPVAAALPRILDIQRALRALQRHRPPGPPTRTVLDEAATADAGARAFGLVIPVFRPESRREATVRLVMDASPSMAVWQEMFEELRSVCERLGAFRDVRVHYLHRLTDGTAAVGRGPAPGTGLRSGDQLRDPTGRALTMVVSDCAGPLWREGEAQRLLYRWAECTPCVVVQPLPQRLWSRSWLPTERGVLERAEEGGAGGGGGLKLRFRSDRAPRPGRPTGGLTVPVLPPNATALGAWARLVAGLGTGPVPAEVGRVLAHHPAAPVPLPRTARPPRELVRRFRASAAPGAVQLAVYLAAAPLTLPVMRLVQRTMLPDSEPSDLAEVLLSGLLRRSGPAPGQWYEFVPGVQDVLLGPLGRDEAALVLKHCSEYVLAHFGRGVRNFPALAVSQLTGVAPRDSAREPGRVPAGRLPQAFAQVSAKVVRRYLPGPPAQGPTVDQEPPAPPPFGRARAVRAARDRLADGDARALYESVALLRRAVAAPAGPDDPPEEAETGLAGALLRLWAAQRDPEVLDEAERAVTGLRTAAARAVLGRVLYERALTGAPDAELLAAADREFAEAGAAAVDPELRRDCAVRRARVLVRLSELRDDPGPLREARAALEALAAADPAPAPELRLALGRVLLALLPRTPDPAERTALAEQAAATLTAVLAVLLDAVPGPADAAGREPDGGAAGAPAVPVAPGADGPGDGGAGGAGSGAGRSDATGSRQDGATRDPAVPVAPGADGPEPGGAAGAETTGRPAGRGASGVGRAPETEDGPQQSPRGPGPGGGGPGAGPAGAVEPGRAGRARQAAGQSPRGPGSDGVGDQALGESHSDPVVQGRGADVDHHADPAGRRGGAAPADGDGREAVGGPWEGTPAPGHTGRRRRARVRVELATALRYLPGRLEEAAGQLALALEEAPGEPELRLAGLLCLARVHRARHARDGDPVALEDAAEAYGRARRLIPRDGDAYAELLPEWGDVLLDRTRAADGRPFASTAVRVLRESRAAVPQSDPGAAYRLLRLAAGLRLRHSYEGDLVDLREAEYLLELAARQSHSPLERARAWREHGDVQQEIHAHTRTADRLDRAADSYRRAWRAALEADREERQDTAVHLAARVQELRGEVLERLARPRAALDAYRAALELWQRLGEPAAARPRALRARVRGLEAGL
ncbi:SAV_2336 N-terminal domain-related protein [Streptomyces sp. NPDC003042]